MSFAEQFEDSKPLLTPAQTTAQKLYSIVQYLDYSGTHPDDGKVVSFYTPESHDLLKAPDGSSLSNEDDQYYDHYTRDSLAVPLSASWPDELDYIKAKLKGIAEGRITNGDGDLGRDLRKIADELVELACIDISAVYSERAPVSGKLPIQKELAKYHHEQFRNLQDLVLEGAGQGLFTSGQPITEQGRNSSRGR